MKDSYRFLQESNCILTVKEAINLSSLQILYTVSIVSKEETLRLISELKAIRLLSVSVPEITLSIPKDTILDYKVSS
jgi:hypothetical protein